MAAKYRVVVYNEVTKQIRHKDDAEILIETFGLQAFKVSRVIRKWSKFSKKKGHTWLDPNPEDIEEVFNVQLVEV